MCDGAEPLLPIPPGRTIWTDFDFIIIFFDFMAGFGVGFIDFMCMPDGIGVGAAEPRFGQATALRHAATASENSRRRNDISQLLL
jgi:hypothetical protein